MKSASKNLIIVPEKTAMRLKHTDQEMERTQKPTIDRQEKRIMEYKSMSDSELENVTGGVTSQDKYYTVKEGDCLSTIANRYNTSVVKLILLNPQIKDPNLIHPGDMIRLYF